MTPPQYVGRIFSVRRERLQTPPTGEAHTYDILDAPDWVNVVALTGDARIVLVRQFRAGTKTATLEIPGGTVDPGETPADAARRELAEETGYEAERWRLLGLVHPNPAFQTNTTFTFLAEDARRTRDQRLDETEAIEVEVRALDDIPGLVASGAITHALVVCAFFHLAQAGLLTPGRP